jgi:transcriptional regulator with XRE-family HTH domain
MPDTNALGIVVRRRRLELGMTQEALAERISTEHDFVRQSEISRIECGRIELPRRGRLERLAAALDLSLGDLLARSGWGGADIAFPDDPHTATPSYTASASSPHGAPVLPNGSTSPPSGSTDTLSGAEQLLKLRRAMKRLEEERHRLYRNQQTFADVRLEIMGVMSRTATSRNEAGA